MKLILISANGYGAGKTTFGKLFDAHIVSLAYFVRWELSFKYPEHEHLIMSREQAAKNFVLPSGKTVRQELVELGQSRCAVDPLYWCDKWLEATEKYLPEERTLVVDDLRKKVELDCFREQFPDLKHFHIKYSGAIAEKVVDEHGNTVDAFDDLEEYADYIIYRQVPNK